MITVIRHMFFLLGLFKNIKPFLAHRTYENTPQLDVSHRLQFATVLSCGDFQVTCYHSQPWPILTNVTVFCLDNTLGFITLE